MARVAVNTIGDAEDKIDSQGELITHNGTTTVAKPKGTNGQFLRVLDSDPSGLDWETIRQVTSGGSNGQVLTNTGSGNYTWQNLPGGGMQISNTVRLISNNTNYTVPSGDFAICSAAGYGSTAGHGAIIAAAGSSIQKNSSGYFAIDGTLVVTSAQVGGVIQIAVISN